MLIYGMVKHLTYICIALVVAISSLADADNSYYADDELAGIKLGIASSELLTIYPSLYKHNLFMGETLYEACNQSSLEVFTFAD